MAITPQYQKYLNSPKWKAKRILVLRRAKYKCEECKRRQATQIHHKTYKRIFNEPLSDLLAVCAPCHKKIHGIKDKPRKQRKISILGQVLARVIR
jgi:5-methylcytosine-specific restriction endonuclease McrA